jgi:hypothetical protein
VQKSEEGVFVKMITVCCGTCKHWDRESAKDGAGRVRADRVAKCKWPIPVMPTSLSFSTKTLTAGYMSKVDGVGCRCWEPK